MSSYGKKRYKEVIYFSLQRHDVEEKEANLKSRLFFFLPLKKKSLGDKEGNDYIYQELNLIKPSRWWLSGKSLGLRGSLLLWSQVRALWLLI
jgi:hypothetical protein